METSQPTPLEQVAEAVATPEPTPYVPQTNGKPRDSLGENVISYYAMQLLRLKEQKEGYETLESPPHSPRGEEEESPAQGQMTTRSRSKRQHAGALRPSQKISKAHKRTEPRKKRSRRKKAGDASQERPIELMEPPTLYTNVNPPADVLKGEIASTDEEQQLKLRLRQHIQQQLSNFTFVDPGVIPAGSVSAPTVIHLPCLVTPLDLPGEQKDLNGMMKYQLQVLPPDDPHLSEAQELPKKMLKRATPEQVAALEQVFAVNTHPNSALKYELSRKLHMTPRRVQVWFQNKRARLKKLERSRKIKQDTAAEEEDAPAAMDFAGGGN